MKDKTNRVFILIVGLVVILTITMLVYIDKKEKESKVKEAEIIQRNIKMMEEYNKNKVVQEPKKALEIETREVAKMKLPWSPVSDKYIKPNLFKNIMNEDIFIANFERRFNTKDLENTYELKLIDGKYTLEVTEERDYFYKGYEGKSLIDLDEDRYVMLSGDSILIKNRNDNSYGSNTTLERCKISGLIGKIDNSVVWAGFDIASNECFGIYLHAYDISTEDRFKFRLSEANYGGDASVISNTLTDDNKIWLLYSIKSNKGNGMYYYISALEYKEGKGFNVIANKELLGISGNRHEIIKDGNKVLIIYTEILEDENPQLLKWHHNLHVVECRLK